MAASQALRRAPTGHFVGRLFAFRDCISAEKRVIDAVRVSLDIALVAAKHLASGVARVPLSIFEEHVVVVRERDEEMAEAHASAARYEDSASQGSGDDDRRTERQQADVLEGRNILIEDATSFEGGTTFRRQGNLGGYINGFLEQNQ